MVAVVSPLMSQGHAFDYVQNPDIDPCPLVYSHLVLANGLHYLRTYQQGTVTHGDSKGVGTLVLESDILSHNSQGMADMRSLLTSVSLILPIMHRLV